jgi:hypothetical protein
MIYQYRRVFFFAKTVGPKKPTEGEGPMSHKKIPTNPKICTNPNCAQINPQPIENFNKDKCKYDGLHPRCRICQRETTAKSWHKHKKKRKEATKKWTKENRDIVNANVRRKRKEDPLFRVAENLRRATGGFIKSKGLKKTQRLHEYLGCTSQEFKTHLESLWQPGMNWDNYGWGNDKWNIDHRIPLASANTVEELYKLSHYSNLQPLWQPDNFIKADKMPISPDPLKTEPTPAMVATLSETN